MFIAARCSTRSAGPSLFSLRKGGGLVDAPGRRPIRDEGRIPALSRLSPGTTLLTMRVRGIEELANWVLGYGAHVKVLRPAALRERVARDLRAASALYSEA